MSALECSSAGEHPPVKRTVAGSIPAIPATPFLSATNEIRLYAALKGGISMVRRYVRYGGACVVEGCESKAISRRMCGKHYVAWKRHGDPSKPLRYRAPWGAPQAYYRDVVVPYDGDDCLLWPFACDTNGHARINGPDGRLIPVARLLCEESHGPPPSPDHVAAHACGKGIKGCVTRRHISWKTESEVRKMSVRRRASAQPLC